MPVTDADTTTPQSGRSPIAQFTPRPVSDTRAESRYLRIVPFYVYAPDRPRVQDRLIELSEAHQSYMDRFADRLILRGPTLSDDGTEHTGSVHVVDLADRASAEQFAAEEPYWRAGLYREVTATRIVVLVNREVTPASRSYVAPSALVTGQWPPQPRTQGDAELELPGDEPDARLRFAGLLVDDSQSAATGIVSVVTAPPDEALRVVEPLAARLAGEPVEMIAQRWRRGGRS
jgi:uncharacterized protein YciI